MVAFLSILANLTRPAGKAITGISNHLESAMPVRYFHAREHPRYQITAPPRHGNTVMIRPKTVLKNGDVHRIAVIIEYPIPNADPCWWLSKIANGEIGEALRHGQLQLRPLRVVLSFSERTKRNAVGLLRIIYLACWTLSAAEDAFRVNKLLDQCHCLHRHLFREVDIREQSLLDPEGAVALRHIGPSVLTDYLWLRPGAIQSIAPDHYWEA